MGWVQYFALAETPSNFDDLDEWLRRRLRQCRWKEWKWGRTRKRSLLKLGLPEWVANAGYSRKGAWPMAGSGVLHRAMRESYWTSLGLRSLALRYAAPERLMNRRIRTRTSGGVRGRAGDRSSYSIVPYALVQ